MWRLSAASDLWWRFWREREVEVEEEEALEEEAGEEEVMMVEVLEGVVREAKEESCREALWLFVGQRFEVG
jgi:hypothetical protein